MSDLFFDPLAKQVLESQRGKLIYYPFWLSEDEATSYFDELHESLAWETESIQMYGRAVTVPRLVAWYGDRNANYRYSGVHHTPRNWTPLLSTLKEKLQNVLDCSFNSVLANWYRHGEDSMGWHSDNEPELGSSPVIASLSFGTARYFDYRLKENHKDKHRLELQPGSLLVMSGAFQQYWQHQVPKQKTIKDGRINLTFRRVHSQ